MLQCTIRPFGVCAIKIGGPAYALVVHKAAPFLKQWSRDGLRQHAHPHSDCLCLLVEGLVLCILRLRLRSLLLQHSEGLIELRLKRLGICRLLVL